ncbi:putative signal peptide-containing protein [Cryptosporidium canis]|nr:putative signal peptide-containing protein [Cryptosporidium canis]
MNVLVGISLKCWALSVFSSILLFPVAGLVDAASFGRDSFGEVNDIYSPCGMKDSPFTSCVSLNPRMIGKRHGREIRYHSSLLYLADYNMEKVILKKPVRFHSYKSTHSFEMDEGDRIKSEYSYEYYQNEIEDDMVEEERQMGQSEDFDVEEGRIMEYLYKEAKFSGMPKLISPNWENTGWIVMEHFDGISLQEFYQAIYKDIDDIKVQNNHQFQDRMIIKKGVIYKELHDLIIEKVKNQQSNLDQGGDQPRQERGPSDVLDYLELNGDFRRNSWFFHLLISQYNAISQVYLELLKKGVIHCNPSPSSIMIKRGKLGIHPNEIIFVDYSQSIKWNIETSQIFYSDIKQSCIPDLRPILAFLLADFGVYIPISSIDATFFGKTSLAPINIISKMDDSAVSGQCLDYNNLLKEYFNTHLSCKDLLTDYSLKLYHSIDCNTPLPYNAALPYNFRIFHFCQKTCQVCNQECEGLVSLMNTELYEESFKDGSNNILRDSFVERLFRACRPNTELLSYQKLSNSWQSLDEWGTICSTESFSSNSESSYVDGHGDSGGTDQIDKSILGCKWCIVHRNLLKSLLVLYELPQIILYPNIDLFVGNINILIDSHQTIQHSFRSYLINMNIHMFSELLTGNIAEKELMVPKKSFVARYKDIQFRRVVGSYLLIGEEIGKVRDANSNVIGFTNMSIKSEFGQDIPSGLLYYKILENDYMFINIKIIKQAFVRYMFKGFSSKYRQRIFEMLKTYSLRLLPNSLRRFPIFETQFR